MEWSSDYITMMFDFIDSSHVASHPQLAKKKEKKKHQDGHAVSRYIPLMFEVFLAFQVAFELLRTQRGAACSVSSGWKILSLMDDDTPDCGPPIYDMSYINRSSLCIIGSVSGTILSGNHGFCHGF